MKKFSFISSAILLFAVVAFLFMACQKEQNDVVTVSDDSESTTIKSVTGKFGGSIDGSYAKALQRNFREEYDDENQTLVVAFSTKDLTAFLNAIKTKSDIIYVNFGRYGKGALAPNPKDNDRMTVFFTGNDITRRSGNGPQTNGTGDDAEYLNHGGLLP